MPTCLSLSEKTLFLNSSDDLRIQISLVYIGVGNQKKNEATANCQEMFQQVVADRYSTFPEY